MIILALAAVSAMGHWEVTQSRDSMNDRIEAQATLNGAGGKLIYMCGGSGASLLSFDFSPPRIAEPGVHSGQSRVDDQPPEEGTWVYEATYATPAESASLISRLRGAHRLRLRVFAYSNSYIEGDFDVTGAGAAFAEADRRCAEHSVQSRSKLN